MDTIMTIVLLFGVLIAAVIYVPYLLMRRGVRQVVSLFREQGAISPETAATLEELGITQRGHFEMVLRMRDYRPHAVHLLLQQNVIRATEEGRLYLCEDELEHCSLMRPAGKK